MSASAPADHIPAIRPLDHLAMIGADDDAALVLRDGVLSYQDLRARVAGFSGWLRHGALLAPGARIATWGPKSALTCLAPLAAARA